MSTERTLRQRLSAGLEWVLGSVRARPWRAAALLGAMVAVMVAFMLAGGPDDSGDRFGTRLGISEESAGEGWSSAVVSAPDTMSPAPVSGDADSVSGDSSAPDAAQGGSGSAGSDGGVAGGGGSTGAASSGGSDPSPGTGTGSQPGNPGTDVKRPPDQGRQPAAPADPVKFLDGGFGESIFPANLTGLKLVLAVDGDDGEVTATYKSDGAVRFDIVRVTVQQTESNASAQAAFDSTLALYSADRSTYTWGGRNITQATGVLGASDRDPALGFVWKQGRYCIDVTVYSPYRDGIAPARDAALEFIGRLGY